MRPPLASFSQRRLAACALAALLFARAEAVQAADRFPVPESSLPVTQDFHRGHAGLALGLLAGILAQTLLMRGSGPSEAGDRPFQLGARLGLWVAFWDPELTYAFPGSKQVLRSANEIAPAPVWEVGLQVGARDVAFGLDYLFDRLNRSIGSEAGVEDADRFVSLLRGQLTARLPRRWLLASSASFGNFHGGVTGQDYAIGADGLAHPSGGAVGIDTRWFTGEVLALWSPEGSWAGAFGGGLRYTSYRGPVLAATFAQDLLDPRAVITESATRRNFLLVLASKDLRRLLPHLYASERWFVGADLALFVGLGNLEGRSQRWRSDSVGGEVDVHVGLNLGRVAVSLGYRNQVLFTEAGSGGLQFEGGNVTGVEAGTLVRGLDFFHGPSLQVSGSF